jgi:hypothetical protein
MARKPSALAGIFDDEAVDLTPAVNPVADVIPEPPKPATPRRPTNASAPSAPARRSSHPGKKPVLIHIPEDMHRALRQLSVEEGGEPLTVVTERLLRQYLVKRGHTRFAP